MPKRFRVSLRVMFKVEAEDEDEALAKAVDELKLDIEQEPWDDLFDVREE